jgi:hypothetical protein
MNKKTDKKMELFGYRIGFFDANRLRGFEKPFYIAKKMMPKKERVRIFREVLEDFAKKIEKIL